MASLRKTKQKQLNSLPKPWIKVLPVINVGSLGKNITKQKQHFPLSEFSVLMEKYEDEMENVFVTVVWELTFFHDSICFLKDGSTSRFYSLLNICLILNLSREEFFVQTEGEVNN